MSYILDDKCTLPRLNLQLFAEGGGDGGGTGDASGDGATNGVDVGAPSLRSKGVKNSNPLSDVKYGIQEETNASANTADSQVTNEVVDAEADRKARFDELIKGEFKDLYDARMQDTIQKRLKGAKETEEKYNKSIPLLDMLADKYGSEKGDIEALAKAMEEDSSYFEDEALEKGITVEQLKAIKKMERENAELRQQMEQRQQQEDSERIIAGWLDESEKLKNIYPGFDFDTEIRNDKFADLLNRGIDVRTAFEVIHKDEIMPAAMQFTAQKTEQNVVNRIMANGMRPSENGTGSQATALIKSDVSQLSKEDRQEIARRVARGEKIRF